MAFRHTIGYSILLVGLTSTVYSSVFLQDNELALNTLFLGLYGTISVLFFLKIVYYTQYNATLNEIYFILFSNLIPLSIISISSVIPLGQINLIDLNVTITSAVFSITDSNLRISFLSLLALPFVVVAIGILVRSFIRYDFIRYTSQSTKGPSAEWTAIISFIVFGILFLITGQFANDLLSLFIGFTFIVNGIGFFFSRL